MAAGGGGRVPTNFYLPWTERYSGLHPYDSMRTTETKNKFAVWPFVHNRLPDEPQSSSDAKQQSRSSAKNYGAEGYEASACEGYEECEEDVPLLSPEYKNDIKEDRSQYINGRSLKYRDTNYALIREVERRIKDNVEGKVLTIMHVRAMTFVWHCTSGFIDLRSRIKRMNMNVVKRYFSEKMLPHIRQDLSYYNFHEDLLALSNSENFVHVPLPPGAPEICFRCVKDNAKLLLSETGTCRGVSRTVITDLNYISVVFYDHVTSY